MARKKKTRPPEPAGPPKSQPFGFTPFKDLKKMLAARNVERASVPQPTPPKPPPAKPARSAAKPAEQSPPTDDAVLLREALAGVRRIDDGRGVKMPVVPKVTRTVVSEDAEVMAQLSDLVSGHAPFDITETDEYVEGMRVGLDPRLLNQLRSGDFALQDHIDLHGMGRDTAHEALTEFILKSVRKRYRTVLVVHGRGLRSPGGQPVLKHAAARWLSHGEIGGHVLAFVTARMQDGGAGALYVMLRHGKRRAPFEILQGAKRRD